MARVAGVDLPKQKRVDIALQYIYGIGPRLAARILESAGVAPSTRVKDLTDVEVGGLNGEISRNYKVEGDLRRDVQGHIKRLIDIGCYRGLRHRRSLPARGQRTRSNARTRRGRRKTVGSAKPGTTAAPGAAGEKV